MQAGRLLLCQRGTAELSITRLLLHSHLPGLQQGHTSITLRARARTHAPVHRQSLAAFGRGDKKGRGEQISRYPEHWLEGTNVSDIIYDVKCSVSALPPICYCPLSFFIWGSGKQKRHFVINDGHDDTAGKILRYLQIF